jgi:parvulin-like peptidyl-prolyl isomerase
MRAAGAARSSKQRSEADAKARAENIYQQLIAGADFEKLAREFSDDKTSAAKGGDFGTAGRLSPYPEEMKKALFGLKPGGISAPLRQPSGYYILKAESLSKQPLSDVKAIIEKELSTNHFNDWIKSIEARYTVDVVDDQYFAGRPPR